MPDTLKAQHIARLTRGNVLYSDMGRILCSITEDRVGWHDPLSGCSNATGVRNKYGEARYQEHRNDCYQNAYDSFLIELAKYGLGPRDMAAPINFFSKVVVGETGAMHFASCNSRDECACHPEHLPASAGPEPEIRTTTGSPFDKTSATCHSAGRVPTIPPRE
jgi:uncharacterized protein YcgI (DUF1989 family)